MDNTLMINIIYKLVVFTIFAKSKISTNQDFFPKRNFDGNILFAEWVLI